MTKIRATCPDCGNVEFGVQRIVVVGQPAEMAASYASTTSVYRFNCPECDRPVHRSAERDIIDLLISVGVHVELPVLLNNETVDASVALLPAFTQSDVDLFRDALHSPGWYEMFLGSAPLDGSA